MSSVAAAAATTKSKSSSKRKDVPRAPSPSPTEGTEGDLELDTSNPPPPLESEDAAAAALPAKKKSKKAKTTALAVVEPVAGEEDRAQLRSEAQKMLDRLSDEEKQSLFGKALVVSAVAAADDDDNASVATLPYTNETLTNRAFADREMGEEVRYMDRYWKEFEALKKNVNTPKGVRCKDPNLAMHLFLEQCARSKAHIFSFDHGNHTKIGLRPAKGGDKKDTQYINYWTDFPQRLTKGGPAKPFGPHVFTVMPFGRTAFMNIGPTIDTGVEGNRGKEISGAVVSDSEVKVGFHVTSKSFSALTEDPETYRNPAMQHAFVIARRIADYSLDRMWTMPTVLTKERARSAADATREGMDQKEYVRAKRFQFKVKYDEANMQEYMDLSAPVFRAPRCEYIDGKKVVTELPKDYPRPCATPWFEKMEQFDEKKHKIHNRTPLWVARHHSEVEEGKEYDAPIFGPVAFEDAAVNSARDCIAVIRELHVYEDKKEKPGETAPILGLIWLSTWKELDELQHPDHVVATDPRKALPMAGRWVGFRQRTVDRVTAGQAGIAATADANGFSYNAFASS